MNEVLNKVIVCDLDGTLAESKMPLTIEMASVISKVLEKHRFVVISGASYNQFQNQFLKYLPKDACFKNLALFPVNGSQYYCYDQQLSEWQKVYSEDLTDEEKKVIFEAFKVAITNSGVDVYDSYGVVDIIDDRGGQITFSGRGQDAPIDVKNSWDPDQIKRKKIVNQLTEYIPEFEIRIGGATSIDVTRKGINKAYAIRKIEQNLNITKDSIVFIGDALYMGGNDATVIEEGIKTIQVSGPEETKKFLLSYI